MFYDRELTAGGTAVGGQSGWLPAVLSGVQRRAAVLSDEAGCHGVYAGVLLGPHQPAGTAGGQKARRAEGTACRFSPGHGLCRCFRKQSLLPERGLNLPDLQNLSQRNVIF